MKKITLLFAIVCQFFVAQNQRFIYQYSFVIDSTKADVVSNELMYLDITPKGSKYYSRDVFVSDSTSNEVMKKQMTQQMTSGNMNINVSVGGSRKEIVRYSVTKTYPDFTIKMQNRLGMDKYNVLDKRKIKWEISPETQKIGEFVAQKATTHFAGRKWTAWFTTELPFQDGPYKFSGLPGLIIQMEDATKSHQFHLKATSKYEVAKELETSLFNEDKAIDIGTDQYKKLFLDTRNDPNKMFRNMGSGIIIKMTDKNGKEINQAEMMKRNEERAKQRNKENNNVLELDLLQ